MKSIILNLIFLSLSLPVMANTVRFEFSGYIDTINSNENNALGNVYLNQSFDGWFSYSSVPDQYPSSATAGHYHQNASISVTLGTQTLSYIDDYVYIRVYDNYQGEDTFSFGVDASQGDFNFTSFGIRLSDSTGMVFNNDDLPMSFNLTQFDSSRLVIAGYKLPNWDWFYVGGEITNMTVVPEPAKTYYVNATDGSDDNDGLSKETAFATIQKAIDSAYDGDTVIVTDGIYTGEGNRDIDFLGKAITVRSESGPGNCIIDCNADRWDPHRGFYFHSGEQENSVVEGFTITNAFHYHDGGAISCRESSPTISNCIITGNSADRGGGICLRQSHSTITNCSITENQGGGICCEWESNPTITNCTIAENQVVGIFCRVSSPVITNCNIAENKGSGIVVDDGSLTVANCTITGNSIEHPGGGGICSYNSELTIDNSTITGNQAPWGGGIYVFRAHRNLIITNCTISGNTAKGIEGEYAYGGGIICIQSWDMDEDEPFTFSNCTISENTAETGGGIYCDDSILTVANCILWDDSATHGPEIIIMNYKGWHSSLSIAYSDVHGGQDNIYVEPDCTLNWGLSNIDADPCFVEPGYWADANDPNIIVEPNHPNAVWVDGDYHLLPDSPCIDTGDPNYIAEPNETDLDGNPRINGGRIDMGAYEYVPPVEAAMQLMPQMLNCRSKGKWIKAHFVLPEGFLSEDVDVNEPAVAEPIGAESEYIRVFGSDDGPVKLEVAFDRQVFCDLLTDEDFLEITVIGYFKTGQYFYGTDTIRIKTRRLRQSLKVFPGARVVR